MKLKFKHSTTTKMSPMERVVYTELRIKNINFFQEVIFSKCVNPKTGMNLRYDFYIPSKNLLIEYDGIDYHQDVETIYRDSIKDDFAKNNQIKLVRLCGKLSIEKLMKNIDTYQSKKVEKRKNKINKYNKLKYTESAIEKYNQGLQTPIITKEEKRKIKKQTIEETRLINKAKSSPRVTDWKPIPYKRIIII